MRMTPPRFLCDEMLRGLARWLRAAGYDTTAAGAGAPDRDLLAQARREGRLLLTRDRKILEHRDAGRHALLLAGEGLNAWARELARRAGVDWTRAPFTRCLLCNTPLTDPPAGEPPPAEAADNGPLRYCPRCGKWYWCGSHVARMRRKLAAWRQPAWSESDRHDGA